MLANQSSAPATPASEAIQAAAAFIRQHYAEAPRVALVLGTGLGGLAERITDAISIPYADIPHFPQSTVVGHAGRLVLGHLSGVPIAAMQGRFHLYEGYTPQQVVLPIRVLHALGATTFIATNAAGGLDPAQHAGDLLLLRDHIGLATMTGNNPLIGPNDETLGPRFPSVTHAYDANLREIARAVAQEQGIQLREGVYVMLTGPNFETPAELRFLRLIGADAVGMSTVPEVLAACHMGMRVLAISCITNVTLSADMDSPPEPHHAEVIAAAEQAGFRLASLIEGVVARLA